MARAQFDRSKVIEQSTKLFWKHGFSASSMQQVVKNTGLKPGSIYLAFGSKEGLFQQALETYAQKSLARIRSTLDSAPSIGEGICTLLEMFVAESTRKDYCSCFLVKTQLELATEGGELHKFASSKLDEIETLYRSYLEREFDSMVSRQRATSIMLHIFGVRVYGYQQGSAERMREGLRVGLPWLPWPTQRQVP
ncbi:TetR/AcrR family transcriptional regulator [Pelobacter seleniigenes]|uniref:TetR/AcrR family transcriptional regulator n=1 Tax=Pelobacter seleniigenes TaxID=407188 RepID=UPI0004A73E00|nr:TetR/AcrR family transcriptional regulator [Pelobacter seleniigenes]